MKLLIKCEAQKLLRQKYFLIGSLILLAFTLFLFFIHGMNSSATYPIDTEQGRIEGQEAALYNKAVHARYAGILTADKIDKVLSDLQTARNEYDETHSDSYDWPVVFSDIASLNGMVYEAGYEDINELLKNHSEPFFFDFAYTWISAFNIFHNAGIVFALFLLIVLSPLFANEYSSGADEIILTTKHGKGKLIRAKFIVAILFTTLAVIVFSAFVLTICGLYFGGFTGWQVDIQTLIQSAIYIDLPIKMNCLQFFGFNVLMYWVTGICVAALTCCCSAFAQNTFSAFIVSVIFYFLPMLLQQIGVGGSVWSRYLFIFPACAMKPQFVINTVSQKPLLIPTMFEIPILIITISVVLSIILLKITRQQFCRHQVA